MKALFLLLFFCAFCHRTYSQTIISWKKNVYFFDSNDSTEHKMLKKLVDSVIKYEGNHQVNFSYPILLDVSVEKELSYGLGYDNLYGTSIDSDIYKYKTWDYKKMGLRVQMYDAVITTKKIIVLIDYGIHHMKELVERRNKVVKMSAENRPRNTSISQRKIKRILNSSKL